MYLLTKESQSFFNQREEIFNNLIKNNYSTESLLLYKGFLKAEYFKYQQSVDLGLNIRNMLAALTLKGIGGGVYIISTVEGKGKYCFYNSAFEIMYCEMLIDAAKMSYNKRVYNYVKLSKNDLLIKIVYKGDFLPDIKKGFLVKQKGGFVEISFEIMLKPTLDGTVFDFKDYYFDRLSSVSLALI